MRESLLQDAKERDGRLIEVVLSHNKAMIGKDETITKKDEEIAKLTAELDKEYNTSESGGTSSLSDFSSSDDEGNNEAGETVEPRRVRNKKNRAHSPCTPSGDDKPPTVCSTNTKNDARSAAEEDATETNRRPITERIGPNREHESSSRHVCWPGCRHNMHSQPTTRVYPPEPNRNRDHDRDRNAVPRNRVHTHRSEAAPSGRGSIRGRSTYFRRGGGHRLGQYQSQYT